MGSGERCRRQRSRRQSPRRQTRPRRCLAFRARAGVRNPASVGSRRTSPPIPFSIAGAMRPPIRAASAKLPAPGQAGADLLTGPRPPKTSRSSPLRCRRVSRWPSAPGDGSGRDDRSPRPATTVCLRVVSLPKAPDDVVVPATSVLPMRLPAALFHDRDFVVEGQLDAGRDRVVQFSVATTPPKPQAPLNGAAPCLVAAPQPGEACLRGSPTSAVFSPHLLSAGRPDDEVVCLKMFHREDEPLDRLFLDADATRRLDRLWTEHRFISRQPVMEHKLSAAVHRLRHAGPAESDGGLFRESTARVPEARRGIPERRSRGHSAGSSMPCSTSPPGPIAGRCGTKRRRNCWSSIARFARRGPTTRGLPRRARPRAASRRRSCSASSRRRQARQAAASFTTGSWRPG